MNVGQNCRNLFVFIVFQIHLSVVSQPSPHGALSVNGTS